MSITFTESQKRVLDARNHNILVSAAAGSGKTAVLVERIVRMISEGEHPLDIDRLLIVTFTRAAAAQMRERIGKAISQRLAQDPGNRHLQRQEVLLHRAQISTIDSFCKFLLQNGCGEIDLDPGFRQMDENEAKLLAGDTLKRYLEDQYVKAEDSFLAFAEYFCPERNDEALEDLILKLHKAADSHPYPEVWLNERRRDYAVPDADALLDCGWYQELIREKVQAARELQRRYEVMLDIAREPDGPYPWLDLFASEGEALFGWLDQSETGELSAGAIPRIHGEMIRMSRFSFTSLNKVRFSRADKELVDPDKKKRAKDLRDKIKDAVKKLGDGIGEEPEETLRRMRAAEGPVNTLIDVTLGFREAFQQAKKQKNALDFSDLEHEALHILIDRAEDGTLTLTKSAQAYRAYYAEVLIDEYQDSNEVQELLLSAVTGEPDAGFSNAGQQAGRYARFMVGDVKQSIYGFRNARPEIFQRKFDTYRREDPRTERIDLDQNFRSRRQVLDAVNGICGKVMRREVGGVEYDDIVSLKPGATYPEPQTGPEEVDPYEAELLVVDCPAPKKKKDSRSGADSPEGSEDGGRASGETDSEPNGAGSELDEEIANLASSRKEALAVAQRIRRLVGVLPVTDEKTGEQRPARYGDIVILMRATSGRQDAFREIFEKEGIPLYLEYKGGYFAAEEIRTVLQMLRIIDNPRQDIPLYGAMRGYFGGFSQDEIGAVRALSGDRTVLLYDCLLAAAGRAGEEAGAAENEKISFALREKCRSFLALLDSFRDLSRTSPIHELIGELIRGTGYEDYVRAFPAGAKRAANLTSLLVKARAFEKTDYAGLFRFLRYIDQMGEFDVDYGEASALDEHADVVRLTTIHKSKGLEYPICFVCGLGSKFGYTRDLSGTLLTHADLGLGVQYVDADLRCAVPTLRQKAVSARIARSSAGEELRVLYVAMTRAKEKLILTGTVNDAEKTLEGIESEIAALHGAVRHLPESMILSHAGYLSLILRALAALRAEGAAPVRVVTVQVSDLELSQIEDQMVRGALQGAIDAAQGKVPGELPDPELARRLERRFSFRYPHEELSGLYTKTTVTELKRAALAGSAGQEEPGGAPRELYPDEEYIDFGDPYEEEKEQTRVTESTDGFRAGDGEKILKEAAAEAGVSVSGNAAAPELPVPRFAQEAPEAGSEAVRLTGAARGTAVHRLCELIDFAEWPEPGKVSARQWDGHVSRLLGAGEIPRSYESAAQARVFLPFLHSEIAARMAAADSRGLLRREQPFVLGVPAGRLDVTFPPEETILIQGIIDAFFIEEGPGGAESAAAGGGTGVCGAALCTGNAAAADDGAGSDAASAAEQAVGRHIVLVDYKTDRVRTAQELTDRYRVQMDYYAQALGKMLRLPVTERILYSFALREEIRL